MRFSKELKDKIIAAEKQTKEIEEKLKDEILADKDAPTAVVTKMLSEIG